MAGTLIIDTLKSGTSTPPVFQNSSGTEAGQLCRAWVNFNGTNGSTYASFNVSSVTRVTTGQYTVNITNALANANYATIATNSANLNANIFTYTNTQNRPYSTQNTTTAIYVLTKGTNDSNYDANFTSVAAYA